MRTKSMVALLILGGILGIVAALWSNTGSGLGAVRMGEEGMSPGTRETIMILGLIGGIGALLAGFTVKILPRKILGVASLVFGALLVPSLFQGNVLSIASILLLVVVGITLLARPIQETQSHTAG
ncbi:MAG: hypothetical protein K9N21_06545 [Deltaproteobacteria bacterium]|nr:hypothetical protein [Deltaproteobacteria bacterium]